MNPRKPHFDRVLSDCVQAVLADQASIASCIERYPEYGDELARLLPHVQAVRGASRLDPTPNPQPGSHEHISAGTSKTLADRTLWAQIRTFFTPTRAPGRRRGFTWALVGSMLVAMLGFGGVGVTYAADGASPGQPLYRLDLAIESAHMALTLDSVSRAELALAFAQERVAEAETLAAENPAPDSITQAAAGYHANMQQATQAVAEAGANDTDDRVEALQKLLLLSHAAHGATLNEIAEQVPGKAAVAIRDAVRASQAALQAIDATRPGLQGDRVPGGAGAPEGAGRPEDAGPPEGAGPPDEAGPPEDNGRPVGTRRPEREATPDPAGPPDDTGKPEDTGPPGDAPGQGK
ncbi:MAG: DUF5667 domain-containing protein [Anaerolineales bacterium]|nr:DUF5667 domain-containing protein [Anaerolineales bacterium]